MGKTTTAVNVAACIADAGSALLVDLDPQCNATVCLGRPRTLRPAYMTPLAGPAPRGADGLAGPGPALSARGPGLAGATVELPRIPGSEYRLRDAWRRCASASLTC